jgi:hypothetical protein
VNISSNIVTANIGIKLDNVMSFVTVISVIDTLTWPRLFMTSAVLNESIQVFVFTFCSQSRGI